MSANCIAKLAISERHRDHDIGILDAGDDLGVDGDKYGRSLVNACLAI
jgi:hypothetical protein